LGRFAGVPETVFQKTGPYSNTDWGWGEYEN